MKKFTFSFFAAVFTLAATTAGCSEESKPASTPTPKPSTTSPTTSAPSYAPARIRASLLSAKEVGRTMQEIRPALDALKDEKVPVCSLTGAKLPGAPELSIRQFTNPAKGEGEVKYAQLTAIYASPQEASDDFSALQREINKCSPKKHVPVKRKSKESFIFAHDDTWKMNEGTLDSWKHVRGIEQQTFPASVSKYNILQMIYDYTLRGNVIVTSVYWERAEPGKSPDATAKRAKDLLSKQLQKIG